MREQGHVHAWKKRKVPAGARAVAGAWCSRIGIGAAVLVGDRVGATAVSGLVNKIERGLPISETDDMALAGILSTQLLHHLFIDNRRLSDAVAPAQRQVRHVGIREIVNGRDNEF